jgi:hypothetical protein
LAESCQDSGRDLKHAASAASLLGNACATVIINVDIRHHLDQPQLRRSEQVLPTEKRIETKQMQVK